MKKIIYALLLIAGSSAMTEVSTYGNPVDGNKYEAEWKTYLPEKGVKDQSDRMVEMKSLRLLSEQEKFSTNIVMDELVEFVGATHNNIEKSVTIPNQGFELLLDTLVTKAKDPEFDLASQGSVSKEQLQKINDELKKLKGFRSKGEDLRYQIHFIVKSSG